MAGLTKHGMIIYNVKDVISIIYGVHVQIKNILKAQISNISSEVHETFKFQSFSMEHGVAVYIVIFLCQCFCTHLNCLEHEHLHCIFS